MNTAEYLAAVKAKLNVTSDYAVAKALQIRPQRMAKYVKGQDVPGPVVGFRIAEILGDQPAAVVADLEAERAERMGKTDDADYLRKVLKRLGGAAASILLAAGFGGFPSGGADLRAAADHSSSYASCKRRTKASKKRAGPWDGLLRFSPLGIA